LTGAGRLRSVSEALKATAIAGLAAQQVAPTELDLGPPLAFAQDANAVGIDRDGVLRTADCDSPLEFFVEDRSQVGPIPPSAGEAAFCSGLRRPTAASRTSAESGITARFDAELRAHAGGIAGNASKSSADPAVRPV
jgi:hypothetical protein